MAKVKPFQLYTGDWLKDPNLSMCSPHTRGIWIDLLCAMHENNRSGQVTGNIGQIARLCRCTAIVTVINRRMKREYEKRQGVKNRVDRHRNKKCNAGCNGKCNGDVTQNKRPSNAPCNALVTTTKEQEKEKKESSKEKKEKEKEKTPPLSRTRARVEEYPSTVGSIDELEREYGQEVVAEYMKRVRLYESAHGREYRDPAAAVLLWMQRDGVKPMSKREGTAKGPAPEPEYDLDSYRSELLEENPEANEWFREKVKPVLREEINEHSYRAFIEPIIVKKATEKLVQLHAPPDVCRWVRENYLDVIGDAIHRSNGSLTRCKVEITSEIPEKHRKPKRAP